ncbi:hypothetical protein [Cytobacillus firmus]|uniref:hypothetical protein n=1 Tax=Cytobacillus firmus TaxID=1399 RepID=UPI0024957558|nr:hypothetical protein [Cytobacillus firmus]
MENMIVKTLIYDKQARLVFIDNTALQNVHSLTTFYKGEKRVKGFFFSLALNTQ